MGQKRMPFLDMLLRLLHMKSYEEVIGLYGHYDYMNCIPKVAHADLCDNSEA